MSTSGSADYQTLRGQIAGAENKVEDERRRVARILALGVPLLALVLLLEALFIRQLSPPVPLPGEGVMRVVLSLVYDIDASERIPKPNAQKLQNELAPVINVLVLWLSTGALASAIYFFTILPPLQQAQRKLTRIKAERYKNTTGRVDFLEEELRRLTAVIAYVFADRAERYKEAHDWRAQAADVLERASSTSRYADLTEVEDLLNRIEELVEREKREQQSQKRWQTFAGIVMAFYVAALIVTVIVVSLGKSTDITIPLFDIPLKVVVWGALGSLAAVLYKFYTARERVNFGAEFRWLIARPIMGIVMSLLVYLVLVSGLSILGFGEGNATANTLNDRENRAVYWIIAFLAGFSDKFYMRIIDALVRKAAPEDLDPARKPEPSLP